MRGIEGIHTEKVPTINGSSFNLEYYQTKDNSRAKRKAAAWGSGDFASVIRQNMNRSCGDYSVDVSQSIILPRKNKKAENEAHTQREEGDINGVQQRLF